MNEGPGIPLVVAGFVGLLVIMFAYLLFVPIEYDAPKIISETEKVDPGLNREIFLPHPLKLGGGGM